ncbi:hypothetical protein [Streptomyces sp. ST2-7A]|uniref:hypothetical protein n=1 Tax=Streptomyces sp. ST2-7A TaxID=2907214 RepID=UPI001F1D791B|nr:hypothetical protein [Streptomyces sp. ST2-7A]MCE7082157.1 hypothetical protein [Streptomyces sp. ST2-7A]
MAGNQRSPIMSGLMHLRAKFTRNFTILPNFLLRRRGSAVVLGVAVYLFSLPEGTPMSIERLCRHFTEGRVRISRALRELEEDGYLERRLYRLADGTVRTRFVLRHLPEAAKRFAEAGGGALSVEEPAPGPEPLPAPAPAPTPAPRPVSRPEADVRPASVTCPAPVVSAPRVEPVPVERPALSTVPAARVTPTSVPVGAPTVTGAPVPAPRVAEAAPERVPADGAGPTEKTVADRSSAPAPVVAAAPRPSSAEQDPALGPEAGCREPVASTVAPTRPEVERGPARPVSRAARTVLDSLADHDPRLLLSERELHDLAPTVDTWLARGARLDEITRALTANLPRPLTHRPARLLAHRLTAFLPAPRSTRTAPTGAPPPVAPLPPWRTCARCDRVAFRSAVHTLCTTCREAPPDSVSDSRRQRPESDGRRAGVRRRRPHHTVPS